MQDALNENGDEEDANLTPEEKAKREASVNEVKDKARDEARAARVEKLVKNLTHKLSIYTDGPCDYNAAKAYQEMIRLEAEDLKVESYGVELLHAIGFTYTLKAKQYLGKNEMLGLGSWFHGVREKGHILSETVSTLRAAMDLQQSFSQLQEAEKVEMDEAAKKVLEEAAASKGLRALWKGSKLEVEGKKRASEEAGNKKKKKKKKRSFRDDKKKHVIDGMMTTLLLTLFDGCPWIL
jgi:surface antigen